MVLRSDNEKKLNSLAQDTPTLYAVDTGKYGVRILIISGVHAGTEQCGPIALSKIVEKPIYLKRGKLSIIPIVNIPGWIAGTRTLNGIDLNRTFIKGKFTDHSKQIISQINQHDLIVDFHSGWGYYRDGLGSIGSTFTPSDKFSKDIAEQVVKILNLYITDSRKKFTVLDTICDIKSTLGCYCKKNRKSYILIEITGQNDVQPLHVRELQIQIILWNILRLNR